MSQDAFPRKTPSTSSTACSTNLEATGIPASMFIVLILSVKKSSHPVNLFALLFLVPLEYRFHTRYILTVRRIRQHLVQVGGNLVPPVPENIAALPKPVID